MVQPHVDQFEGCFLGLALGDALGAPFEGGFMERWLWNWIGKTKEGHMRWTDDTQMSLDVADSLIELQAVDADDMAKRFAASYRWSRGYGPGAAKTLKAIAKGQDWQLANKLVYPNGSYGNGGAMRAPVFGMVFAGKFEPLLQAVRLTTGVTHDHPWALEGAQLIAQATSLALQKASKQEFLFGLAPIACSPCFCNRLELIGKWVDRGHVPTPKELVNKLGNGMVAHESCMSSIMIALQFWDSPFELMMDFVTSCGGDVDTISAMCGALWGARNGRQALPAEKVERLEAQSRLVLTAQQLYELNQAMA